MVANQTDCLTATASDSEGDEIKSCETFAEFFGRCSFRRPAVKMEIFQIVVAATTTTTSTTNTTIAPFAAALPAVLFGNRLGAQEAVAQSGGKKGERKKRVRVGKDSLLRQGRGVKT